MQLEEYFDFLAPDDIRLKGSRVGVEHILFEYIHNRKTAEQLAERFPTVSLEQVYATILYYLRNRDAVTRYYVEWIEWGRQMREQQPPPSPDFLDRARRAREELAGRRAGQLCEDGPSLGA